jgi:hypothetical protein
MSTSLNLLLCLTSCFSIELLCARHHFRDQSHQKPLPHSLNFVFIYYATTSRYNVSMIAKVLFTFFH